MVSTFRLARAPTSVIPHLYEYIAHQTEFWENSPVLFGRKVITRVWKTVHNGEFYNSHSPSNVINQQNNWKANCHSVQKISILHGVQWFIILITKTCRESCLLRLGKTCQLLNTLPCRAKCDLKLCDYGILVKLLCFWHYRGRWIMPVFQVGWSACF
jgi:hypothetical protein